MMLLLFSLCFTFLSDGMGNTDAAATAVIVIHLFLLMFVLVKHKKDWILFMNNY
jgi:hypothetical protein